MKLSVRLLAVAIASAFLLACSGGGAGPSSGPTPPPPAAPGGFAAAAATSNSITLSWTASGSFSTYKIYRNGAEVATVPGPPFTDTGLTPGATYQYFIRGVTPAGVLSAQSPTISATTSGGSNSLTLAALIDPAARSYMMVRDIEFDAAGDIFITGGAFSANFPTTAGAYDRTFSSGGSSTGSVGPSDVFVMKFNRAGQLIWSTLIGGPNHDRAYGLEIAPDGGVIVAGRAGEGFPTTAGVIQPNFAGDTAPNGAYGKQDGFVAKLSADGSQLLWSTYFGSSKAGALRDVGVDSNNKVYVVGAFFSGLAHITGGAVQSSPNGQHDLVYARLNANATAVEYSTYLGGAEPNGETPGTPSITVTPGREVFVVIEEGGTGAPTSSNAYQRNGAGGVDFLIAKFSPSDQLVYATYLGGGADEDLETHNLAVDGAGRAVVASISKSSNYPVTTGAYQQLYGGGSNDGVISILSADGSSLVASTFFGGAGFEDLQGVEVSTDGRLYIAGGTASSGLHTTSDAFQTNFAGVADAFLASLTTDLRTAPFVSYLGGTDSDIARAMDTASDGAVAFGGVTRSPNLPVSGGGSTTPNGGATTGWWALKTP